MPLNLSNYLVKEHIGIFKAANNFDIYDPGTGKVVLECREKDLGVFTKILRFTDYKRMTPFSVTIQTPDNNELIKVKRGVSIFISKVKVFDGNGTHIGGFRQKFWSLGGKFQVHDTQENPLFVLQGKWTGWEYKFMLGDKVLATVNKKWSGIGKELFTSADNYMLTISDDVPKDNNIRKLILASVMCIDLVLKE